MLWGFILWIVFAVFVSLLGDKSTLGKAGVFMVSLVFSPIIGLFVCLITEKSKAQIAEELAAMRQKTEPEKRYTTMEEKITLLRELKKLLEDGLISECEFEEMRLEIMRRKENSTFEERCPIDPNKEVVNLEPPKDESVMKPVVIFIVFLTALALYAYYLTSTSVI